MRQLILAACLLGLARPASAADPVIVADVVYGRKDGMALTYDVVKPAEPNGAAVLWVQSGGWYSGWTDPAITTRPSRRVAVIAISTASATAEPPS